MRRSIEINSIRPEFRGKKMIAIIELLRLLVSYSVTGDQKMSRSNALSIFLIRAVEPFIQAIYREASVNLSSDALEKLSSLAATAGVTIDGGEEAVKYAQQMNDVFAVKPAAEAPELIEEVSEVQKISFVESLSDLSDEEWS